MPNLMQDLGTKIGGEFKTHRLRIENVESTKVDKVVGKQLSTEDYTTAEKTKLSELSNYTLPVDSTTVLGGVKAGANVTVDNTDPTTPVIGLGTNVTVQGNTFNGAGRLVKLDVDGKLPVLDGSNLTGIDGLPEQTGYAGMYLKTDGITATWVSAQEQLVSGTNIKTVNGESVLGGGDISIPMPGVLKTGDIILTINEEYTVPQFADCNGNMLELGVYPELEVLLSPTRTFEAGAHSSAPAETPNGTGRGVAWSPDGTYMSVVHDGFPLITIYKREGDIFRKLSDPAQLPSAPTLGVAWSPDGVYMSVVHDGFPLITIYKREGDIFTKLSDPSSVPLGTGYGVAWSPDGVYMSVVHESFPFITTYKREGDIFTKLSDPAQLPSTPTRGVAWSPDGTYMSVVHIGYPYTTIYKREGDIFTKLSDPSSVPLGTGYGVAWSPDGVHMSVAHNGFPFITTYKREGDIFTKLSDQDFFGFHGTGRGVAWSPDGTYMSVAHDGYPYTTILKKEGDILRNVSLFGLGLNGPARGVAWSPDGTYMSVAQINVPYIAICIPNEGLLLPNIPNQQQAIYKIKTGVI